MKNLRKILAVILAVLTLAGATAAAASAGNVIDTLNGVPAYSSGVNCAEYVHRYYSQVFGVTVYNLLKNQTPCAIEKGCQLREISRNDARVGDIVYQDTTHGHWAIVKHADGGTLTLIEQNFSGKPDRQAPDGVKVFRLYKNGADANNGRDVEALERAVFSPRLARTMYSDLAAAFPNDDEALFQHWLANGQREGRVESYFFDPAWYLSQNPDVCKAVGWGNWKGAADHFFNNGFWEGRQGSPLISVIWYENRYSDIKNAFGGDLLSVARHIMTYGVPREWRQTSSQFCVSAYKNNYVDLQNAFRNDAESYLIHYEMFGKNEGRRST